MQVRKSAEYRRMPWKNGGGVTTEIAVFPEGAGVEDFDWRVSMATVSSDGPFSLFDGVDRTLSILQGEGIALSVDGAAPVELTAKTPPFAFAADLPAASTLLGGPVLDLNVMTRRGCFVHTVQRLSLSGRTPNSKEKTPLPNPPHPNPPHKGEGLPQPPRRRTESSGLLHAFSPLVGEMAGRPEGDFAHSDRVERIPTPSPALRLLICTEGEFTLDDASGTVLDRYDTAVFSDGEIVPTLSSEKPALAYLVILQEA